MQKLTIQQQKAYARIIKVALSANNGNLFLFSINTPTLGPVHIRIDGSYISYRLPENNTFTKIVRDFQIHSCAFEILRKTFDRIIKL